MRERTGFRPTARLALLVTSIPRLGQLPHPVLRVRSPSWASLEPSARGRLRSGCPLARPTLHC